MNSGQHSESDCNNLVDKLILFYVYFPVFLDSTAGSCNQAIFNIGSTTFAREWDIKGVVLSSQKYIENNYENVVFQSPNINVVMKMEVNFR